MPPLSHHAFHRKIVHYCDAIMGAVASQITSLAIVYSTVYSDPDQRKHQSSTSLAFVRGIHWGPVNSPHKWPVARKMLPFDDVTMVVLNLRCLGQRKYKSGRIYWIKWPWPWARNGWSDWRETKRKCTTSILDQLCDTDLRHLTLTFNLSRSTFSIAVSQELLVWLMWSIPIG